MKNLYALMTILILTPIVSQVFSQSEMTLHFGPTIPVGEFADDDIYNSDSGLAGLGIGVGLSGFFPLNDNGLGMFGGMDILFNPLNNDAKDMIEEDEEDSDFTFPKYFNIPVSVGLQYNYEINTETKLYGKLGLALSFTKLSNFKWEEPGDDDYIESYELATGFGSMIGGGAKLNDKVELGLNYMALGNHKFEGKYEYGEDSDSIEDFERLVNMVYLTVGFNLN